MNAGIQVGLGSEGEGNTPRSRKTSWKPTKKNPGLDREKPWLFSGNEDDAYFRGLRGKTTARWIKRTGKAIPHLQCERRFIMSDQRAFWRALITAADPSAVQNSCRNEPLICGDLQASRSPFQKPPQRGHRRVEAWRNSRSSRSGSRKSSPMASFRMRFTCSSKFEKVSSSRICDQVAAGPLSGGTPGPDRTARSLRCRFPRSVNYGISVDAGSIGKIDGPLIEVSFGEARVHEWPACPRLRRAWRSR